MRREPLGSSRETSLSPSPRTLIPSLRTKVAVLRTNSRLWRSLGLTTTASASFSAMRTWSALSEQMVDFPHWREQLRITEVELQQQEFGLARVGAEAEFAGEPDRVDLCCST